MESTYRPILHIDDNEDDIFLLHRAMEIAQIAHPIEVADNGNQAMKYLRDLMPLDDPDHQILPSLILLDWHMPQCGGLEFLKWRQAQPAIKVIPVIVLTTSQHPTDVTVAYGAGANGYLVKPNSFEGLVEMVKAIRTYWLRHNHYAPPLSETDLMCA